MQRAPRPRNEQEARERKLHLWRFAEGNWRCAVCATWKGARRLPEKWRKDACRGPPMDDKMQAFAGKGHRLCRTGGDAPIVFCARCGAWASRRPRKLKNKCTGATAPGRQALARIAKGLSPWEAKSAGGGGRTRSSVKVEAAFCETDATWKTSTGRGVKRSRHECKESETGGGGTTRRRTADNLSATSSQDTASGAASGHGLADATPADPRGIQVDDSRDEWQQEFPPELMYDLPDPDPYEADEEAAAAMGWTGGLDADGQDTSQQAAAADANDSMKSDGENETKIEAASPAATRAPKRGQPQAAFDDAGRSVIARKAHAREKARETAEGQNRTATQRAIQELGDGLREGPRDGAARLEALRQRIKQKQQGREEERSRGDGATPEANAEEEGHSVAERVPKMARIEARLRHPTHDEASDPQPCLHRHRGDATEGRRAKRRRGDEDGARQEGLEQRRTREGVG